MQTNTALADLLRPRQRSSALLYDLAVIGAGSFLVALGAQLAVGWPVPITAQTFVVLTLAALLGPVRAPLCMIAYIGAGAAGLPAFAGGRGGPAVLLGPTGGYLLGFVAAAYIVGHLAQRGWDRTAATTALAMAIGNIVIYACGLLWLGVSQPMGLRGVLAAGLWPFIPGDLLKIALAALLLPGLWKLLGRR